MGRIEEVTEGDRVMQKITEPEGLAYLEDENVFMGELPGMESSAVVIKGRRNILFCEAGVKLQNTTLTFHGSDSVIYLCSNHHKYKLNVSVYNHTSFYAGRNNYFNGVLNVVVSEQKHIFIGNDGLFSFGIWLRNADPHLIYDSESKTRINPTKSIFIGDHVWTGQSAVILKGTQIDSGSIIGAMSVVSGKKIPANTSWAGNPVKKLKDHIFWEESCVHAWTDEQTKKSKVFEGDSYIYTFEKDAAVAFDDMDAALTNAKNAEEMLAYLQKINKNSGKNRFVHQMAEKKIPWWKAFGTGNHHTGGNF